METYQAPQPGAGDVVVDPNSNRLQLLEPFKAWDGKDLVVCPWRPIAFLNSLVPDSCAWHCSN